MAQYLDLTGLQYSTNKTKEYITDKLCNYNHNILLDTNCGSVGWMTYVATANILTHNDTYLGTDGVYFENTDLVNENVVIRYKLRPEKIKAGNTYKLSFKAYQFQDASGLGGNVWFRINLVKPDATNPLADWVNFNTQYTIIDNWIDVEVDLTATTSGTETSGQWVYMAVVPGSSSSWYGLIIKDLKLVEKSTENVWEASPEDYNKGLKIIRSSQKSLSINPNYYYDFGTLASGSTLMISFATPPNSNILNKYIFQFTSNGGSLSLPSTVKWMNGETPTIESGYTYQISITNDLAVCAKFA